MTDILIDWDVIRRTRTNMRHMSDLLSGPGRDMRGLDADAVGVPELERRLDEFGEEWEYGIGQLARFAGNAAEALDEVETAFRKADEDLARALTEAANQK